MPSRLVAVFIFLLSLLSAQEIIVEYLVENGDTLDIFSYQIPEGYDPGFPAPLLVAFHVWGGNHNSNYSTGFDEQANERGWFFLSPWGGSGNNYTHQGAQYLFKQEIIWLEANYNIDPHRIYMVGGSMGGGAGMIFSNNHLDPDEPMVAATASGSGILDCERRYWEMDGNNSMIEWFGGTPEEVPFEYHRNSAVFFEDQAQSMHFNLQHVPLYMDFSGVEAHRYHAEDLYSLLTGYNPNMWIETEPTGGHGWPTLDDSLCCDWMAQFELVSDPDDVNVNLDEPSRAYWAEVPQQITDAQFIRIHAVRNSVLDYVIDELINSDSLLIHTGDELQDNIHYDINTGGGFTLGQTIPVLPVTIDIMRDGELLVSGIEQDESPFWYNLETRHTYRFIFEPALPPDVNGDGNWDVLDIVLTVNFIVGTAIPDENQFEAADINDDGVINILDVVTMVNLIIGQ